MKKIFHSASSRGAANHGWLQAKHSFSFANYYDSERVQFGALRVLNDDIISPGMGFGTHPHDNMEIITIPLKGTLEHKDSMDNIGIVEADEIQVMSAGSGVYHSEYNKNKDQSLSLLQIWVFPNKKNVTPRYDQKNIKDLKKSNSFYPIVTPNQNGPAMWIHQDAWFHLGEFDKETKIKRIQKRKTLENRSDDELGTILKRYDTYMETTKPVLDFYSKNPNFHEIDGSTEIEQITNKIDTFINV
mgnify:CR=1 FL=1